MAFRVGVNGYVALVQVRNNGVWQWARRFLVIGFTVGHFVLGNQHGDRRAMGLVVLAGNRSALYISSM